MDSVEEIRLLGNSEATLTKWKVKEGSKVVESSVLCEYQTSKTNKLKCHLNGVIKKLLVQEGQLIKPGESIAHLEICRHPTVWRNMCAECGADLRDEKHKSASVAMEHSIPDLLVSEKSAQVLGKADEERLLSSRKLVLLVDLDQTLIHSTNDNIPSDLKDVYHFQLSHGQRELWWYHTKFRPHTETFLENISKLFELHICTFGVRTYAHAIARFLDPDKKYFQQRILSRDECFHPTLKTSNLKALFPCGDSMVTIIDDREDVWKNAPNLVHVKPYRFFDGTADINAPPEANKSNVDTSNGQPAEVQSKTSKRRKEKIVRVPVRNATKKSESNERRHNPMSVNDSGDFQKNVNTNVSEEAENKEVCSVMADGSDLEVKNKLEQGGDLENISGNKENDSAPAEECSKVEKSLKVEGICKVEVAGKEGQEGDSSTIESSIISNEAVFKYEACVKKDEACVKKLDSDSPEPNIDQVTSTATEQGKSECDVDDKGKLMKTEDVEEYKEMIEWEDLDDYLIYLEDILTRIHTAFYEMYDQSKNQSKATIPDLKQIVPYVRKKVLKGTNIVFSGVFPTNQAPETTWAYRIAESLGATIQTNFVPPSDDGNSTTHVIAAKPGTEKVRFAAKHPSVYTVNPDWLLTCSDRWERVDERLYVLADSGSFLAVDSPEPNARTKSNSGRNLKSVDREAAEVPHKECGSDLAANNMTNIVLYGLLSESERTSMLDEVDDLLSESSDSSSEDNNPEADNPEADDPEEDNPEWMRDEEEERMEKKLKARVLRKRDSPEDDSSSEAESMNGDFPKGWKKSSNNPKRRKLDDDDAGRDSDVESRSSQSSIMGAAVNDDDSEFSVDDEMAAAVEREFLS